MLVPAISQPSDPRVARYQQALPATEFAILREWIESFYRFQREWLLEQAKVAICNKARQIGMSHCSAGRGVLHGAYHGETTTIISEGDREAGEVLDKAKKHASVLVKAGSRMARMVRKTTREIEFASGGRVIALPASAGRGFTGNVILDEFAYHDDADKVWDAAAAVALLGFRVAILSTPNGVGNDFANLWEDTLGGRMPNWAAHETDIDRAIADGYPVDMQDCWTLAKNDPRVFDQLFRCKFLDNVAQYITSDLIKAASEILYSSEAKRRRFAGLDIGETRDKTSLVVVEEGTDDVLNTIHVEAHDRTDDELIDNLAEKAFDFYGVNRLVADETGLGTFPAKRIRKKYGSKFEPITFSLKVKEELCTCAYDLFTQKRLTLLREYKPDDNSKRDEAALLRDDISAIRRMVTAAGNVRFDAQRTKKGHADRAWALFMATHAASRPKHTDRTVYSLPSSR